MTTAKPENIDEYIATFPPEIQQILQDIRITIKKVVPEAQETISYGIPAFNLNGTYLIYFAAYKKHIGLYPFQTGINELGADVGAYKISGKGTIQFPLNKPMPLDLISKLVRFRVGENIKKVEKKKQTKKSTDRSY